MNYQIISEAEFPWGVECAECERALLPGQPYITKLEDMAGEVPIEVVCCVYC
jgi:hypothetical protein